MNLNEAIDHTKEKAEELKNIGFDINTRYVLDYIREKLFGGAS